MGVIAILVWLLPYVVIFSEQLNGLTLLLASVVVLGFFILLIYASYILPAKRICDVSLNFKNSLVIVCGYVIIVFVLLPIEEVDLFWALFVYFLLALVPPREHPRNDVCNN